MAFYIKGKKIKAKKRAKCQKKVIHDASILWIPISILYVNLTAISYKCSFPGYQGCRNINNYWAQSALQKRFHPIVRNITATRHDRPQNVFFYLFSMLLNFKYTCVLEFLINSQFSSTLRMIDISNLVIHIVSFSGPSTNYVVSKSAIFDPLPPLSS